MGTGANFISKVFTKRCLEAISSANFIGQAGSLRKSGCSVRSLFKRSTKALLNSVPVLPKSGYFFNAAAFETVTSGCVDASLPEGEGTRSAASDWLHALTSTATQNTTQVPKCLAGN